jgi:hypothetical protein
MVLTVWHLLYGPSNSFKPDLPTSECQEFVHGLIDQVLHYTHHTALYASHYTILTILRYTHHTTLYSPYCIVLTILRYTHLFIDQSLANWRTTYYDKYQRWWLGIY